MIQKQQPSFPSMSISKFYSSELTTFRYFSCFFWYLFLPFQITHGGICNILILFIFSYYRHPDFVEWRIRTYLLDFPYMCMCTHTLLHPSSQHIKHFLTKSFIYCLHFYNYQNILHSQVM